MNNIRYYTGLTEGHRPDLHPNGKIVRCVEDKRNGYLVVTTDKEIEPNTWLVHEKNITKIEKYE
jgi:hypothetical protein